MSSNEIYTLRTRTFSPVVESHLPLPDSLKLLKNEKLPMQLMLLSEPMIGNRWGHARKSRYNAEDRFRSWKQQAPLYALVECEEYKEGSPVYMPRAKDWNDIKYVPWYMPGGDRGLPGNAVKVGYLHKVGNRWVIRSREVNPYTSVTKTCVSAERASDYVFDKFKHYVYERWNEAKIAMGDQDKLHGIHAVKLSIISSGGSKSLHPSSKTNRGIVSFSFPDKPEYCVAMNVILGQAESMIPEWEKEEPLANAQANYDFNVKSNQSLVRQKRDLIEVFRRHEQAYWDAVYDIECKLEETRKANYLLEMEVDGIKETDVCSDLDVLRDQPMNNSRYPEPHQITWTEGEKDD